MLVAGLLDQSHVREFLCGPLFEVEVHDRDRVIHKFGQGSSLFGEERDDELLAVPNTGLHLRHLRILSAQFDVLYSLGISETQSALMLAVGYQERYLA